MIKRNILYVSLKEVWNQEPIIKWNNAKHGIKVLFMTHSIIGLKFENQNQEIQTKPYTSYPHMLINISQEIWKRSSHMVTLMAT
jgi:hypothetical protein